MDYRDGKKEILKKLYVQTGLEDALALPPDLRPHYLSLVLRIPQEVSRKLIRKAIDWTNNWSHKSCYVQRHDTLHITLVDIGRTCLFQSSLQELIDNLERFLKNNEPPSLVVTLKEAKIGSSGINCELDYDGALDKDGALNKWVSGLGEAISVGTVKILKNRSISLVRYRTQSDNDWDLIRNYLMYLESVDASIKEKISFDELSLVRLDKVAQFFDVFYTFQV